MWNNDAPPLLQTDCLYDEFWKALKQFRVWCKSCSGCDVLESKPARLKKTAGGWGGRSPPHLQTQRRYDGFWEGSYGEYTVAFELSGLRDLRQKQWSLYPHSVTVQYRVQIPGMWIPWVCYGSEPVLLRIGCTTFTQQFLFTPAQS